MQFPRHLPYRVAEPTRTRGAAPQDGMVATDVLVLASILAPLCLAVIVARLSRHEPLGSGDTVSVVLVLAITLVGLFEARNR